MDITTFLIEFGRAAAEVLSAPAFISLAGIMFVVALFLGAALVQNAADFWRLLLLIGVFIFFEESLRRLVLTAIENGPTWRPTVLAFLSAFFYLSGLFTGYTIVITIQRRYERRRRLLIARAVDQFNTPKESHYDLGSC